MTDRVRVWDGFVRLFHWSLVALIAGVWLTAEGPRILHERLGYVIAGLIALRVVWGVIGPRHARFADFIRGPRPVLAYLRDLRAGREHVHAAGLALAQEVAELAHLRLQQPIADLCFPARFELDGRGYCFVHHTTDLGFNRDSRSWNSTLVTSRRSSIGLSTRSLAPACSSAVWLSGLPSPVITSTGRRRLP